MTSSEAVQFSQSIDQCDRPLAARAATRDNEAHKEPTHCGAHMAILVMTIACINIPIMYLQTIYAVKWKENGEFCLIMTVTSMVLLAMWASALIVTVPIFTLLYIPKAMITLSIILWTDIEQEMYERSARHLGVFVGSLPYIWAIVDLKTACMLSYFYYAHVKLRANRRSTKKVSKRNVNQPKFSGVVMEEIEEGQGEQDGIM